MGGDPGDAELIAPWLAEGERVLWVGHRKPRVWLRMAVSLGLVAAVVGSTYVAEVVRGHNPLDGGLRGTWFVVFWLFVLVVAGSASIPGLMLARDMGRRTRYVVTDRRAMLLIPIGNRVLNRYVELRPGMPVRVRSRWGDTARLQVGRSPSLRAEFSRLGKAADAAVDVGWAAMQACSDPDGGAEAARTAIAALG